MDQFVCVRLVQGNAMDLTLFQFDYDLTFAAFFMNADRTVYGRFGSRSDRQDATKDMTMEGFRKAMAAALDWHRAYPKNKDALAGKQGRSTPFKTPDDFPSLQGKYKPAIDYEGKVVQSCMHCHQVRDAERLVYRSQGKPIPDSVLYPWPMPTVVGLALDPDEMATVKSVAAGSSAEKDGFKPGDKIVSLEGQALLSIADIQWVLHHAPDTASLRAEVRRGDQTMALLLTLPEGWRKNTDIGWRVTSWELRRMATGGLVLKDLADEERASAKLASKDLGLLVEYVGQYGDHATGKKAGFMKDDIIVAFDGQSHRMTESQFFGYTLQKRMPGQRVPVTVLRGGKRVSLELPLQ